MNPLDENELFKIFKTSAKYPDRLIKREDKNHEFKASFNMANAAMYLKTIAAFANNEIMRVGTSFLVYRTSPIQCSASTKKHWDVFRRYQ